LILIYTRKHKVSYSTLRTKTKKTPPQQIKTPTAIIHTTPSVGRCAQIILDIHLVYRREYHHLNCRAGKMQPARDGFSKKRGDTKRKTSIRWARENKIGPIKGV